MSPVAIVALQTAHTLFDPAPSRHELGYGPGGLNQALQDTVRACLPGRWRSVRMLPRRAQISMVRIHSEHQRAAARSTACKIA